MASRADIKAGRAFLELTLKDDKLLKGLRNAKQQLQNFGTAMMGVGATVTAIGAAATAPFIGAIKAASDFEETMSKFNVVFGESAVAMKEWGDEYAKQVGRSKGEIAGFLAEAQDTFVPLGFDPQEAEAMSKQLATLAVDLASFNNMSDRTAFDKLLSAMVGNTENLRSFGVVAMDAQIKAEALAQGFDPKNLSAYQKSLVIMELAMKGTAAAQGDATRTAGSFANQLKALEGSIKDTAIAIGQALIPVVAPYLKIVASTAKNIQEWISANSAMVQTAFKVAVAVTAVGAAIATAGVAFFGLGSAVGAVAGVIVGLKAALTFAAGAATFLGPLLVPIGAAVVAIGVAMAGVTAAATALGVAFVNAVKSAEGEQLRKNLADIWKLVKEITGNVIRLAKQGFAVLVESVDRLVSGFNSMQSRATTAFTKITSAIHGVLDVVSLLTTDGTKGWAAFMTMGRIAALAIRDAFMSSLNAVGAGFRSLVSSSAEIGEIIGLGISAGLQKGIAQAVQSFYDIADAVADALKISAKYIDDFFTMFTKVAAGVAKRIAKAIGLALSGSAEGAKGLVRGGGAGLSTIEFDKTNSKDAREVRQRQIAEADEQIAELTVRIQELGAGIADDMVAAFEEGKISPEQEAQRALLEAQLAELRRIRDERAVVAAMEEDIDKAKELAEKDRGAMEAPARAAGESFGTFSGSTAALQIGAKNPQAELALTAKEQLREQREQKKQTEKLLKETERLFTELRVMGLMRP